MPRACRPVQPAQPVQPLVHNEAFMRTLPTLSTTHGHTAYKTPRASVQSHQHVQSPRMVSDSRMQSPRVVSAAPPYPQAALLRQDSMTTHRASTGQIRMIPKNVSGKSYQQDSACEPPLVPSVPTPYTPPMLSEIESVSAASPKSHPALAGGTTSASSIVWTPPRVQKHEEQHCQTGNKEIATPAQGRGVALSRNKQKPVVVSPSTSQKLSVSPRLSLGLSPRHAIAGHTSKKELGPSSGHTQTNPLSPSSAKKEGGHKQINPLSPSSAKKEGTEKAADKGSSISETLKKQQNLMRQLSETCAKLEGQVASLRVPILPVSTTKHKAGHDQSERVASHKSNNVEDLSPKLTKDQGEKVTSHESKHLEDAASKHVADIKQSDVCKSLLEAQDKLRQRVEQKKHKYDQYLKEVPARHSEPKPVSKPEPALQEAEPAIAKALALLTASTPPPCSPSSPPSAEAAALAFASTSGALTTELVPTPTPSSEFVPSCAPGRSRFASSHELPPMQEAISLGESAHVPAVALELAPPAKREVLPGPALASPSPHVTIVGESPPASQIEPAVSSEHALHAPLHELAGDFNDPEHAKRTPLHELSDLIKQAAAITSAPEAAASTSAPEAARTSTSVLEFSSVPEPVVSEPEANQPPSAVLEADVLLDISSEPALASVPASHAAVHELADVCEPTAVLTLAPAPTCPELARMPAPAFAEPLPASEAEPSRMTSNISDVIAGAYRMCPRKESKQRTASKTEPSCLFTPEVQPSPVPDFELAPPHDLVNLREPVPAFVPAPAPEVAPVPEPEPALAPALSSSVAEPSHVHGEQQDETHGEAQSDDRRKPRRKKPPQRVVCERLASLSEDAALGAPPTLSFVIPHLPEAAATPPPTPTNAPLTPAPSSPTLASSAEGAPGDLFKRFLAGFDASATQHLFSELLDACNQGGLADTATPPHRRIRELPLPWQSQMLWQLIDAKLKSVTAYTGPKLSVVVVGGGPVGLRLALELQAMGHKVTVLEKRSDFSRINRVHLWDWCKSDLKCLGAKIFDPPGRSFGSNPDFCHIGINELQSVLLKFSLMLGVDFMFGSKYLGMEQKGAGQDDRWHMQVQKQDGQEILLPYDVLVGADGANSAVAREPILQRQFEHVDLGCTRQHSAIGIVANFVGTPKPGIRQFSWARQFAEAKFKELQDASGISLENCVYYHSGAQHYVVMTPTKESLIQRSVFRNRDAEELFQAVNINRDCLRAVASEAAAHFGLPVHCLDFAEAPHDANVFDFSKMKRARNSCAFLEGQRTSMALLVGDALLEPFWPEGLGIMRGFLSAMDAVAVINAWSGSDIQSAKKISADAYSALKMLNGKTAENILQSDVAKYAVDLKTRYR